mmetsp:Transcript_42490/g.165872  ORF Transcript_42490/g.165872 Transcript_42490/m.165872 type:complete len:87 (-) Transcript_42490:1870-2130(-)
MNELKALKITVRFLGKMSANRPLTSTRVLDKLPTTSTSSEKERDQIKEILGEVCVGFQRQRLRRAAETHQLKHARKEYKQSHRRLL